MHCWYSARHIQKTTTTTRTTPAPQMIKLTRKPLHGQRTLINKFRAAVLAGGRWHSQSLEEARAQKLWSLLNKHRTHKDKEHIEPGAGVKCEGRWCRHRHDIHDGIPSARGRFWLPGGGELISVLPSAFSFLLTLWSYFLKSSWQPIARSANWIINCWLFMEKRGSGRKPDCDIYAKTFWLSTARIWQKFEMMQTTSSTWMLLDCGQKYEE